jgi:ribosomal protein S18 acetylase RimI-like enzyme
MAEESTGEVKGATSELRFRTIELTRDAETVLAWSREAFAISFGEAETQRLFRRDEWLGFIGWGASAFPDGFVLAYLSDADMASGENPTGMVLMDIRDASRAGSDDLAGQIGYIHLFYVAARVRGTGIANALQRHADAVCRRLGVHHIELNVEPENARAVRFYQRVGYAVAREILREGLPVLRMRRALSSPSGAALSATPGSLAWSDTLSVPTQSTSETSS